MDTDGYHSVGVVLLAFILILLNAFFVLSEFAMVKVRRSRLEELVKQNNQLAKLALKMSHSLDSYLSATQLGITLSSLALGWVGSYITALILSGMHSIFDENVQLLDTISLLISFSLVTLLHVILGEIVPKSVAIAKSEKACLAIVRPLYIFSIIFYPVIKFFDFASAIFLKLLNVEAHNTEAHSDEELKIIVGESLKGGYLDSVEGEIIKNAVDFSDTLAREVMTPRKDMVCLDKTLGYEKNIEIIISGEHTRYPYCNGGKDDILGVIHIRDILAANIKNDYRPMEFDSFVKKMLIVSESASISQVLLKMNKKRVDTALVIDEYGGTAGMITAQDIMYEIIGSNIGDVTKAEDFKEINEKVYEVDGKLELEKIENAFGFEYDEEYTQVTVGGYVLSLFGDMPSIGDIVSDSRCQYEVLAIEETRIIRLKITLI